MTDMNLSHLLASMDLEKEHGAQGFVDDKLIRDLQVDVFVRGVCVEEGDVHQDLVEHRDHRTPPTFLYHVLVLLVMNVRTCVHLPD